MKEHGERGGTLPLRPVPPLRVMLSSRCRDQFDGRVLSEHRDAIQKELEAVRLFGAPLFLVWTSERAGPAPADASWWEWCLAQARDADIVVVLWNGCSGSELKATGGIGICHAELQEALRDAPRKVRIIALDPLRPSRGMPDDAMRAEIDRHQPFAPPVRTAATLQRAGQQAVLDAVRDLAELGGRSARQGRGYQGEALAWRRLSFATRREQMRSVLVAALAGGRRKIDDQHVVVTIAGRDVLVAADAIPAALSVAAARELVGQPFLRDHLAVPLLVGDLAGPVHFIACQRGVTEAQAVRQLGYPDAMIVAPPFGIYVADDVQKIQMIFLANCADAASTRLHVQDALTWLDRAQEGPLLRRRAEGRAVIVRAIAGVQIPAATEVPPTSASAGASPKGAGSRRR